jgi:UDP-glucose 4-epimerase
MIGEEKLPGMTRNSRSAMPPRTVLVTGAGGFIGSALVSALLGRSYDVVAVDLNSESLDRLARLPDTIGLHLANVDITDQRAIVDVVMKSQPAAIVHLAALHLIPVCEVNPRETVEVNLGGLSNILEAAGRAGVDRMVFASSADVYAASGEALAETDPTRPSSVYGASKLLGERLVAEWAGHQDARRATSLRVFNVYGRGDGNAHVIPDILSGLAKGSEIRVGNVDSRRDFIYLDDVVEVLCRILGSAAPPDLVNVGTGLATSVAELLDVIRQLVAQPFTWISDSGRVRAADRFCLRADTSRLQSVLPGFAPRGLEAGLADMLAAGRRLGGRDAVPSRG